MHILIIEDDLAVAEQEKKLLKGHNVEHVSNLHDIVNARVELNYKYKAEFDIVILDLKLPDKNGEFYEFDEVIERVRTVFRESIIIIVSGHLDLDTIALADEHNIICLDKTLLMETKDFIEKFNQAIEVSKMRSGLLQHVTTDAIKVATNGAKNTTMLDQAQAIVFLGAGLTFIFLPWLVIGSQIYGMLILKLTEFNLPMYKEILGMCFLALASLAGVSLPWLFKWISKGGDK